MLKNSAVVPFNDLSRVHKSLTGEFIQCLSQIIDKSEFVNGSEIPKFETGLADIEGMAYSAATSTGTSAIELALRAFGIGKGDEVITTSFTFVATVHSILQVGALPVLVDISQTDCLLDPNQIEGSITSNTRAIIVVSLHGRLDHINEYRKIADKYGLFLILDGSQSHLARWKKVHQGKFFDAMTLSFYPGKNLGSLGEAGAVLSDRADVIESVKLMRDWGAKRRYEHAVWGSNYRVHNLQAGFLNIKLPFLEAWTLERKRLAEIYYKNLPARFLRKQISNEGDNVYHIFDIIIEDREKFMSYLLDQGISTAIHYPKTINQHLAYKDNIRLGSTIKNSSLLAKRTVSLPLFPGLTNDEQGRVIDVIENYEED